MKNELFFDDRKVVSSKAGWIIVLFGFVVVSVGAGIDCVSRLFVFSICGNHSWLYWLIVFLIFFGILFVGYGFAWVQASFLDRRG